MSRLFARFTVLMLVFAGFGLSWAQLPGEQLFQVFVDKDTNIGTGCDVTLADGSVESGFEFIVSITTTSNTSPATVTSVSLTACRNGAWAAPIHVSPGGWAIGSNNGISASDVIEAFVPVAYLGETGEVSVLAQAISASGAYDLIGPRTTYMFTQPIPALSFWGLILFLVMLTTLGLLFMRRARKYSRGNLVLLFLLVGAVIWAANLFVADGNITDWGNLNPLMNDPVGDSDGEDAIDLRALFIGENQNSDGTLFFRIDVVDIENQAPTDILLDNNNVDENQAPGAQVGNFSTIDPNSNDVHSYSLVSGTGDDDNASFNLVNNQLQTAEALDFEGTNPLSIRVQTDDGRGGTFQKTFSIDVNDLNDAPTDIALDNQSVDENLPTGTLVGNLSTIDQDTGDSFTYSLVNIADGGCGGNSAFSITGSQLLTAQSLDFETQSSFEVCIRTNDGQGGTFDKAFTLTVNNVNEGPVDIFLSNAAIQENQPIGTTVGTFTSSDPDPGQTHAYSLVAGLGDTDNDKFAIVGDQLQTAVIIDFETQSSFSIRVRTDDSPVDLTFDKVFTLTGTDTNDAPDGLNLDNQTLGENNSIADLVGTFSTTDQDPGDTHSYSLVAGIGDTDNARFQIVGDQLQAAEIFDFETLNSMSIRVQTDDGNGGTLQLPFTITITDNNDAPTALALDNSSVDENQPAGTLVGNLSSTDQDAGDTHTYSLVAGIGDTDNASFQIVGNQLQTAASLNFESNATLSIRLQTDDGNGGTFQLVLSISVNDLNESPTDITLSNSTVDENQPAGTAVGNFTGFDPDAGASFSFSLIAGAGDTDNASFQIVGDELQTAASFDFESQASFSIRVQGDDNQLRLSVARVFTINANDINDAPTALALDNSSVDENQPVGTAVGNLSSTDQDAGDSHSYSLVAGAGDIDNASFTIAAAVLQTAASFDFETKSSYAIRIQTNDGNGGTFQQALTINVADINDAPVGIDETLNVLQGGTATTLVGGNTSVLDNDTDQDGNGLTASLVTAPTHASAFTLNPDGTFSYTHDNSANLNDSFTYRPKDGTVDGNLTTVTITTNGSPVAVDESADTFQGGTVTTLNGGATSVLANDSDPETDPITAVLVTGPTHAAAFSLNADGTFSYTNDGTANNSDSFTYRANDGNTSSNLATVTLTINLTPTAIDDNASGAPGGTITTLAGGITSVLSNDTDPETDPLTASLVLGPANASAFTLNADGTFSYTHDGGVSDTDSFTYRANDGNTSSNIATVNISMNQAPVATDDSATLSQGGTVTLVNGADTSVLDNDNDPDTDPMTAALVTGPTHSAAFTLNADGTFSYTHDGTATTSDSFTYTASDGSLTSNTATVSITINLVPTGTADATLVCQGGTVTLVNGTDTSVLDNDSDPETDPLTAVLVTGPSNSAAFNLNADGTFSYTHDGTATNSDSFTYRASDGTGSSAITTVSITIDLLPTATNDSYNVHAHTEFTIPALNGLLGNDSDPEASPLAVSTTGSFATTNGGSVTINANGSFTFTPAAADVAGNTDSFTYVISDGSSCNSSSATVTLTFTKTFWFVRNNTGLAETGSNTNPFSTLAAAEAVSGVNDFIFVFEGDGTLTGHNNGIALKNGQRLIGEASGVNIDIDGLGTLINVHPAGNRPLIGNAAGHVVTLADDNLIEGVNLNPTASAGIFSNGGSGGTADNLVINVAASSDGVYLIDHGTSFTMTNSTIQGTAVGTNIGIRIEDTLDTGASMTFTNTSISNLGNGLNIADGNPDVTFDGSSSISQTTGGRALSVLSPTGGSLTFADSAAITVSNLTAAFDAIIISGGGNDFSATFLGIDIDASSGNDAIAIDSIGLGGVVNFNGDTNITGAGGTGVGLAVNSGTIDFTNLAISGTTGSAFKVDDGDANISVTLNDAIDGNGIDNSSGYSVEIINLQEGAVVTFDGGANTAINDTGDGVFLDSNGSIPMRASGQQKRGVPVGALVTFNNAITVNSSTGVGIDIADHAGLITFTDVDITTTGQTGISVINAENLTINSGGAGTATVNTTNGIGLNLQDVSGTDATLDSVVVNAAASGGISLVGLLGTTNLGLVTITNTGQIGFEINSGGTVNITDNTSSISTTNAPALVMSNSTISQTFASVSSTNSGTTGFSFTNLSGTLAINGGTISGATGTAFNLSGGTPVITYAGTITNTAGRLVSIANLTGGSATFNSGTLSDTAGTGILLQNNSNSPVISFNGMVNITNSTGAAVTLTSNTGGSFNFADLDINNATSNQIGLLSTGANTGATLNTSTGTIHGGTNSAVDLNDIALGITLFSTTSIGGTAAGIDLQTTTGSFTVTGDGGGTNNASGGTISGKAGGGDGTNGVHLATVQNIGLGYLDILNNNKNGVYGNAVNGLVLTRCNITNNADQAAPDEAGILLEDFVGSALAGSNPTIFDNILVNQSFETNVLIRNNTGVLTDLRVNNSTFSNTDAGSGASGFEFDLDQTSGTTNVTALFDGCTFNANLSNGLVMDSDGGVGNLSVQNSVFTNNNVGVNMAMSNDGNLTFDISGNPTIDTHGSHAINVFTNASSTGTASGTITSNTIGSLGTANSGSLTGYGIRVQNEGAATVDVVIDNNEVYEVPFDGIIVQDLVTTGTTKAQITNNSIDTTAFRGIQCVARISSTMCLDIQNNATANTGFEGIRVRQRDTSTLQVERYSGAAADTTAMANHLAAENPAAGSTGATVDTTYSTPVADGACGF